MSTATLIDQFTLTHWAAMQATNGIGQEQSVRLPEASGNCMNWVLGHLVVTRGEILRLLGSEPVWDQAASEVYKRGVDRMTDSSVATDFDQIRTDFDGSQAALIAALEAQTPETLSGPVGFSFLQRENETLGAVLAGFAFHESYHVGQLGILRRFLGHPGIIK